MNNQFLVPVITPYLQEGSIDHKGLSKIVRHVLDAGADGIYSGGSTAECFLLSQEERKQILETVIKAADGATVVAHVGSTGTGLAIDLAKHAEKAGANSIASIPPFYYSFSFDELKGYYNELCNATKLKMMIYNLPSATKVSFTINQFIELFSNKKIYSIKYTDTNYYIMEQVKSLTNTLIYSGADECFLSAISAGADGAIGTTFNFMVNKFIKIKNLYEAGNIKQALKEQSKANNIIRSLVESKAYSGTKYILQLQGIEISDFTRRPFRAITAEEKEIIKKIYFENI